MHKHYHHTYRIFTPSEARILKWLLPLTIVLTMLIFNGVGKIQGYQNDHSKSLFTIKVVHTGSIAEPEY